MGQGREARYAVHAAIGRGGHASVHVGRLNGPFSFSRTVAIKRLHPELARDPHVLAAFVDEARLAARIRDVHVVPTIDAVAHEGELFVVMDYVHGESLAWLLASSVERRTRIPRPVALAIVCDVLRGLHAAHEAKGTDGSALSIVHRDVSPHNVLVGVDGIARVLDFGVAKARGRLLETQQGKVKGKLGYMPPEQLCGEPLDRRADVYAAGVVLWEALTCERLLADEHEEAIIERVLAGRMDPPSARVPDLPPSLDAVFLRAVQPEPSRRFSTALEMAQALEACGEIAPPSDVGAWVQSIAEERLAERTRAIEESEAKVPLFDFAPTEVRSAAARPARGKRAGVAVIAAFMAAAGLAAAYGYADSRRPPVALAPDAGEAPPEEIAPALQAEVEVPDASRPPLVRSRPRATAPPGKAACNPPFFVDSEGHKKWKRECF